MEDIGVAVRCAEDIKELTRLMLERLRREIFIKRLRMTMDLVQQHKNLWRYMSLATKMTKKVLVQYKDSLK